MRSQSAPSLRAASAVLALLALAAAPGCKSDPETPPPPAAGEKGVTAGTPAAPAAKLDVPADVLAYGGSAPLDQALGALHGVAKQVAPVPDLGQMVGPAMQGEFRLSDPAVIDLKRAIYFAVLNPKVYAPAPAVVIAPITSKDAVMKALPTTGQKTDDAGNAVSYLKYEGAKSPVFVNFVEGYAVFTRAPEAFPKNKAFIEALSKLKVAGQGTAYLAIDHAMAAFGAEFDAGMTEVRKAMEMAGQASPGGAGQVESLQKMMDWMGRSARELAAARITALTTTDGLKLDLWLEPKKGSPTAGYFEALAGTGATDLVGKLPANAPVLMHFSADQTKFVSMAQAMTKAFVVDPVFGGDAAKGAGYMAAMEKYLTNIGGEMALAGLIGANGLDLGMIFTVKDAKAVREAQLEMAAIYQVPEAAAYYEKLGVKVDFKPEVYKVGDVSVAQINTELVNMPPEAAQMAGLFSELMNQYIAVGDKLGVLAYGANAKATIEGFLNGTTKGGLDQTAGVKRALANSAANRSMLAYVNVIELVKAVKLGGMNPLAPALKDITAETGIALSVGSTDGNLEIVIDVPVETVKQGMVAFEKGKSAF